MCLFRKNKINLVNWIFGLIAVGIIVSSMILVIILYNKAEKGGGLVDTSRFEAERAQMQKKVASDYVSSLQQLRQRVQGLKNWDEVYSLVEKEFFSVHVPQQYLDKHLQSWIAINKLNELASADRSSALVKILDDSIATIK